MFPIHRTQNSVFNYDEIPAGYYYKAMVEGSATQRFWHRKKFEAVAAHIQNGERVLDVGCGPGSFFSVLCEVHPKCEGIGVDVASRQIDFASEMLAKKFPPHNGISRLKFERIALENPKLPFPDHSFDKVTSIEVIEHIHPYLAIQMYAEMRRVLKPGGSLIVTTPNYRSLWPFIEFALEKLSPVKYHDQHINKFTPSSFVKFLESAGFEVTFVNTIFILAPFLSKISWNLAEAVHKCEQKIPLRAGSLLLAECKIAKL